MTHIVRISAGGGIRLFIDCSCDPDAPLAVIESPYAELDELNRLVHEHIEAAEKDCSDDSRSILAGPPYYGDFSAT